MKCTLFVILLAVIILCSAYGDVVKRQANNSCNMKGGETGMCLAYARRFSYNKKTNSCYNFVYGGCGGNANRFISRKECERACKK